LGLRFMSDVTSTVAAAAISGISRVLVVPP